MSVKKDMIIAGGFNVYFREVDEVLFQHPEISGHSSGRSCASTSRFQVSCLGWK